MTEEREIAGFVLPLAAGIAACTLFTYRVFPVLTGALSMILAAMVLPAAIRWKSDIRAAVPLTFALAFLLGIFCMSTSSMLLPAPTFRQDGENFLIGAAGSVRGTLSGLPFSDPRTAPLLAAFITGDKSGLAPEVKDAFRQSGGAHLLALSGLHMGIIYVIVVKILAILGRSMGARIVRWFLLLLVSGGYTLATGASPSLVRAFLFIFLRETSLLLNRPQHPAQIMMSALLLQLLGKPQVLFSTGFQLSYLAVAGIIYLYPHLKKCWPEGGRNAGKDRSWMAWVWNSACLSISCQLTTAPLVWLEFGSLPSCFLLTNLIAIPLTGILIPTGLAAVVLDTIGCCPGFIAGAADHLAGFLISAMELIAGMQTTSF